MRVGRSKWLVPMLAAIGLAAVLITSRFWLDDAVVSTPTPTKTPVQESIESIVGEVAGDPLAGRTGFVTQVSPLPSTAASAADSPIASPTPIPTFTPSASPPARWTATPSTSPVSIATATPIPTFTPPVHSDSGPNEQDHYWLERPIPSEYTNWVDRNYPYGSTGGGTLPTHHGVEFYNPVGVPVLAAGPGLVVTAGSDNELVAGPRADYYGNLVIVRHKELYEGQQLYTLYGHLSEVLVAEGATVATGEVVGLVGGTGVANGGAHLHFEVRVGENSYERTRNPELWLRPFRGRGTIAGRLLWPDGSSVYGASLLVRRADDPTLFVNRSVYTYADDTVNGDDAWRENWTTPDLEAGPYEVIFRSPESDSVIQELVWVYPGETSLVTFLISG